MTDTKATWIGLSVPAGLGAVGVVVAVMWLLTGPAASKLRGPWPDAGPTQTTVPPGPPGVFTKGDGEMAEDITAVWPQFLGPKRNALSMDFTALVDTWPADGPHVAWALDLGPGHAGPVIYDGRAYVLDYQADQDDAKQGDVLRCLSMTDGKEIWRYWYHVPLAEDHGISRTVPAIADDYIVTFGPSCHTMCLDALTGDYQWGMSLVGLYNTRIPEWYAGQCPLIDDGRAIFATGGDKLMIAVDLWPEEKGKGTVVWAVDNPISGRGAEGLQITHSSIVPITFKGKRVYLYCTTKGIVGVGTTQDDEGKVSGKLLWRYANWRPGINAPSPVVLDAERFAVTSAEGGLILRMVEGPDGAIGVEEVAKTRPKGLSTYQQTPVVDGGYLYVVLSQKAGSLRGQLVCLDVTGDEPKTLWTSGRDDTFRWGPYLKVGDKMFLLNDETGELTMARVSPDGYKRLAGPTKLLHNGDAWAPMALANGRLLIRDQGRMLCLDLRAARPAGTPAGKPVSKPARRPAGGPDKPEDAE